ncbi:uncharacterized protein E0L32_000493 [Thyridium curvatum]|uniref:DHHA2 domain-containing protein n=1 Tax=Thyridium curvatum TaxID=1093900 RepID=A0A507B9M8_9PEZI|nr:uncharacterized protein E0L32_000493 [Thyridium curvatum]TPX14099.1 hypothetical protein E0L32_000493 [Thyridium curvatum]
MPPPRPSLSAFLSTARKALLTPAAQRPTPLTFVVGNESADLDSLCSAVLLAYFRTHAPPHRTLHIPLSNLPRADLALRPELEAVLAPAGLQPSDLLTLTELPGPEDLRAADTRWVLVDHNALTGGLAARFRDRVVGCVDHHDEEGQVPEDCGDEPRVVRRAGSCMSLVVEHVRHTWRRMADDAAGSGSGDCKPGEEEEEELDAQLARVALGPILIDTVCLRDGGKTTGTDVRSAEFAEGFLLPAAGTAAGYDRGLYFDEIVRLKEDISGLGYRDVLRKDYKRWDEGELRLGMSSVLRGFAYLAEQTGTKQEFLDAMRSWAREQGLDILALMTVEHPGGQLKRELLVWALSEKAKGAAEVFAQQNREQLQLDQWQGGKLDDTDGQDGWRKCWVQGRADHSRKQVGPMLRRAMKDSSKL